MALRISIIELFLCCLLFHTSQSCYSTCITKFSSEMEKARNTITSNVGNTTVTMNNIFCRAMSNQIQCLQTSLSSCPPQQQTLVQNMLSVFIRPDYQRTCVGRSTTTATTGTNIINPTLVTPQQHSGVMPNTQVMLMCSQKVKACQTRFNQTFTSYMATYNVSGICQTLKQFTGCLMTLISSQCSTLVSQSRAMVVSMQEQYGSMCSSDAQASTLGMLDCVNRTMQCYEAFNTSFMPALEDYNLMLMCQSLDNYSQCSQDVSMTQECASTAATSLQGIDSLRTRYNIYCGDDSGKSTQQCMQRFQECFTPFNQTFFPALHSANLTNVCSSLTTYTACVGRLNPTCSQQLSDMIQSAQAMRQQYYEKCHPSVLELSKCQSIGRCSHNFLRSFPVATTSHAGICGTIGDYFPCVAQGIEQCQLPQSTTEVSFRNLGSLMKTYCNRLASNVYLLKCPAFVTCTAAVLMSFSPNMRTMFEGSTWCTFMQMSVGCAEHALQSNCFLRTDTGLQQTIQEMDQLRVRTCEAGAGAGNTNSLGQGTDKTSENLVDGRPAVDKNSAGRDEAAGKGKKQGAHKGGDGGGNKGSARNNSLSFSALCVVVLMAMLNVVL